MFYIEIADLKIKINNKYDYVHKLCRDYIMNNCDMPELEVEVSDIEIEKERQDASNNVSPAYAEAVCIYRNICKVLPTQFDAYLLHSALIEYEGIGYAFAAKSGTGKSTHISIWKKVFGDDVNIVNGDKPILRYKNNEFVGYGTPWCGKEGFSKNTSVPLKALCFIERSEKNSIERILPADAVTLLFNQILIPDDIETVNKLFSLLEKTLNIVPCYLLKCNMNDDAAVVAYNGMRENSKL